jgi:2-methylisocitrate lyase-like PEP mutase family enzyme
VRIICSSVTKPVNVLAVPGFTVSNLAEAGAKRISLGSKLTTFAYGMLQTAARELLEEGTFDFARQAMPFAKLQGMFSKFEKD